MFSTPSRCSSRSSNSRPAVMFSSRFCCLNHWRIFVRARRRLHEIQVRVEPVAAGTTPLRRQDLHLVAALQGRVQADQLAAHLGAAAAVADVRVHAVCEVDGRRAGRQVDHLAPRGEDVDPILEELLFRGREELAAARLLLRLPIEHRAQPLDLALVRLVVPGLRLVAPVGGDADVGDAIHVGRADLHLERPTVRPDDGGVQRLVLVLLGVGDVVVEFAGDGPPEGVHHAERRIAVSESPARSGAGRAGRRSRRT